MVKQKEEKTDIDTKPEKTDIETKTEKTDIVLDSEFSKFLDSQKETTKNAYKGYYKLWVSFTGLNGKESLDFKRLHDRDGETEQKVIEFRKWLTQTKSDNSAKTGSGAIRGFFTANRLKLSFTQSETKTLKAVRRKTEDYKFSKEDLFKMCENGDLKEKYIVIVGKSLGLRASDFLTLTYGRFRSVNIDSDAPLYLGKIETQKESVTANGFLDSDAQAIIRQLLDQNKDKKDGDRVLESNNEQILTQTIQRLFEKAKLNAHGKIVRFHELRSFLIDRLTAICNSEHWKQIVGKAISESAYVTEDQLREIYLRAMPSLLINGHSKNNAKLEELETENETMRNLLVALIGKDKIDSALSKTIKAENGDPREILRNMSAKEKLKLYEKCL